jgi:hypothetical protein
MNNYQLSSKGKENVEKITIKSFGLVRSNLVWHDNVHLQAEVCQRRLRRRIADFLFAFSEQTKKRPYFKQEAAME